MVFKNGTFNFGTSVALAYNDEALAFVADAELSTKVQLINKCSKYAEKFNRYSRQ